MPEMPPLKKPYIKPEVKRQSIENMEPEVYVSKIFKEVGEKIGFNINDFPELKKRLVELADMPKSHFKDAVDMARIVEKIWQDIEKSDNIELNREELMLACLFHDIGKSGPVDANSKQRMMMGQIYNSIYFHPNSKKFKDKFSQKGLSIKDDRKQIAQKIRESTIEEALDIEDFPNKEEIKKYLSTLTLTSYEEIDNNGKKEIKKKVRKLDIAKDKMIDLWREHDRWTFDLLLKYAPKKGEKKKTYKDKAISKSLRDVASSHHTLEKRDPALVDGRKKNEGIVLELIDKYTILTLVDKYQAYIGREGMSHEEAIDILKKIIEDAKNRITDTAYAQFKKYIGILERHGEIIEITNPSKK